MAARFSASAILRPALAAHAGLSTTSLLCSAFGPSQIPSEADEVAVASSTSSTTSSHNPCHQQQQHDDAMASACTALPWLDQLHGVVAAMYCGGLTNRWTRDPQTNVLVQIGKKVSLENPIVSYKGVGEVERALRGRLHFCPRSDVETVLECVNVEASDDAISGGGNGDRHGQSQHSPIGIPSSIASILSSPPKVEVTYRLSQQYGAFFSVTSLLVVTVQVKRGCSIVVRTITPQKEAMPLATSGFTPRAASSVAVAATSQFGMASVVLANGLSKIVAATRGRHIDADHSLSGAPAASAPLEAEIVRIEEQWNGVQLVRFPPFHWSRRLNGLVASSAASFFFT